MTIGRDFSGKPIRKSFYSKKSYEDAKEKGERYKTDQEIAVRLSGAPEGTATFRAIAEKVVNLKRATLRPKTISEFERRMQRHVMPHFGDMRIDKIKRSDLDEFFLSKSEYAAGTLKLLLCELSTIMSYAEDNQLITHNPCKRYKLPDVGKKKKERAVLTAEQYIFFLQFLQNEGNTRSTTAYIMAACGLSRSEALGLTWNEINLDAMTIDVCRSVVTDNKNITIGEPKNSFRRRTVVYDKQTADFLQKMRPEQHNDIYVASGTAEPDNPSNFSSWFDYAVVRIRKQCPDFPKISTHCLRHSVTSLWVAEGRNLFAVAAQCGWSDLSMLRKVYAHVDLDAIRQQLYDGSTT